MAKSKNKNKNKNTNNKIRRHDSGVEAFEDDTLDTNDDDDDENEEVEMATKNKKRRTEEEIDEEEQAATDEVEDEDDEDDEEEVEIIDPGFAPYIIHEEQEWSLEEVIENAEPGEDVYFYMAPNEDSPKAKWFKFAAVEVGEIAGK